MSKTTILYLEDEESDAFLFRSACEEVGLTNPIQVTTTGQMAIDYLSGAGPFGERSRYPLPGLVLLDLKVPKHHGLEVLEWIRSQPAFKALVVIVLISSPDARDAQRAYALGANSYVQKPSHIFQLTELVRCLQDWWLQWNYLAPIPELTPSLDG